MLRRNAVEPRSAKEQSMSSCDGAKVKAGSCSNRGCNQLLSEAQNVLLIKSSYSIIIISSSLCHSPSDHLYVSSPPPPPPRPCSPHIWPVPREYPSTSSPSAPFFHPIRLSTLAPPALPLSPVSPFHRLLSLFVLLSPVPVSIRSSAHVPPSYPVCACVCKPVACGWFNHWFGDKLKPRGHTVTQRGPCRVPLGLQHTLIQSYLKRTMDIETCFFFSIWLVEVFE